MKLYGNFYLYVKPHDSHAPWVIRYTDKAMPEGINEVQVKNWASDCMSMGHEDPLLEAKIGKYAVEIVDCECTVDLEKKTAIFVKR